MTAPTLTEMQKLLANIKAIEPDSWGQGFVESLINQVDRGRTLSPRQVEVYNETAVQYTEEARQDAEKWPEIYKTQHREDALKIAAYYKSAVDVLQIPAFLCRQTDLLIAAAKTGKIINVKKGQFLAPWDMANVIKKIEDSGNKNILITERGASFGYNTLVSDMRALPIMSKFGFPIVFDATHSVQQPGGMGEKSGGQREFVPYLARAAIAVGVGAIFMETHEDPDNAPSDGPNMVPLNEVKTLLKKLTEIDKIVK